MRGNSAPFPLNFSFKIVPSVMLFINIFTESLVSLQSRGGLILRKRMMGNDQDCKTKTNFAHYYPLAMGMLISELPAHPNSPLRNNRLRL
jgi:hypothetical protein